MHHDWLMPWVKLESCLKQSSRHRQYIEVTWLLHLASGYAKKEKTTITRYGLGVYRLAKLNASSSLTGTGQQWQVLAEKVESRQTDSNAVLPIPSL